jgi:hypothetical protein
MVSPMKRLLVLVSLLGLWSCQPQAVKSSCYECQVFATNANPPSVRQTKTFCDKAEMDRFVLQSKGDPAIAMVECKNK